MKKFRFTAVIFFFLGLMATSCTLFERGGKIREGEPVRFKASASYLIGGGSKTAYSNEFFGAGTIESPYHERIDWSAGDSLIVFSGEALIGTGNPEHYAQFKVDQITASGRESDASMIVAGNDLRWGTADEHHFFGLYPSPQMFHPADSAYGKVSMSGENAAHSVDVMAYLPAKQSLRRKDNTRTFLPDMRYAYMVARKTVDSSSGSEISLSFHPIVTAFDFRLIMEGSGSLYVRRAELIVDDAVQLANPEFKRLCGAFKAEVQPEGAVSGTTFSTVGSQYGSRVYADFPDGVLMPTEGSVDSLRFVLFTMPFNQSGITFRLTLNSEPDGSGTEVLRHLDLKYKNAENTMVWYPVEACKKVIIRSGKIPETVSTHLLQVFEGGERLGREYNGSNLTHTNDSTSMTVGYWAGDHLVHVLSSIGNNGSYVAAPWTAQYLVTTGSEVPTPATTGWSDTKPLWLTAFDTDAGASMGAGTADGAGRERLTATVSENISNRADFVHEVKPGTITDLKNAAVRGSEGGPYDLSMHYIPGDTRTHPGKPITANCYVVNAPGWYMLPVVYGNAVDAAMNPVAPYANEYAYKLTNNGQGNSSKPFYAGYAVNAAGSDIKTPFILDDATLGLNPGNVSAVVTWQETPKGFEIIEPASVRLIDAPVGSPLSCKYIRFRIKADDIKPGNALISLKDTLNNCILWSWQIWVTADPLEAIEVKNQAETEPKTTRMLNVDMGWTAPVKYEDSNAATRRVWVKIAQASTSRSVIFELMQDRFPEPMRYHYYAASVYFWGRPSPYPTLHAADARDNALGGKQALYFSGTDDLMSPECTLTIDVDNVSAYRAHARDGIRYPAGKIVGPSWGVVFANAWDSRRTVLSTHTYVTKTVYDPSPPGWCVPPLDAFSGFSQYDTHPNPAGAVYYISISRNEEIGMPRGAMFSVSATNSDYGIAFYRGVHYRPFANTWLFMFYQYGDDNTNGECRWFVATMHNLNNYSGFSTSHTPALQFYPGSYDRFFQTKHMSHAWTGEKIRPVQEWDRSLATGAATQGQKVTIVGIDDAWN